MALKLFTSNYLESLVQDLAGVLKEPLTSPFTPDFIVVQSKGMEHWVSMQLARYNGIAANCRFPFPNAFIKDMFGRLFPAATERSVYDQDVLTWRIMRILPNLLESHGFEGIQRYIEMETSDLRMLQLSAKIAYTFDQYLIFRPDMIAGWENGNEFHWQAVLWREVVGDSTLQHRASLGAQFMTAMRGDTRDSYEFPERVSVFGISALPRFHMELLAVLAQAIDVNLFLMNPCSEYWGDILSEREMRKPTFRRHGVPSPEELYMEKGNSILASMGSLGRDFFDLITEFECEEYLSYVDPGMDTLLACLQSDILHLCDRPSLQEKMPVAERDRSVMIHSCHGPMREVEVLYDNILDMLERNSDLNPRDIVVMAPDIEEYAPYIQAVFDVDSDESVRIPYTIADRSSRVESDIVGVFFALLGLTQSRLGVSEIIGILECEAVHRTFRLTVGDLELIYHWLRETRVRWGIDGEYKTRFDLLPFRENTWRAGLERLVLGYALPVHDSETHAGIFPYDGIEGDDALVLGGFVEFLEKLFGLIDLLKPDRSLSEWALTLTYIMETFFMPGENNARDLQLLRDAILDLDRLQSMARFDENINICTVMWYLERHFDERGFGSGFIAGGVTFCAMLPMRSIPFKVVCLIGMSNDAYPRQVSQPGFDLMARQPRPGDRSRRNDDRYLFLETILSARTVLYISYVGQSIQDNSCITPSVPVSELLDYLDAGFCLEGKNLRDHIVTTHRLQAFNPEYFSPRTSSLPHALFSYSDHYCRTARAMVEDRRQPIDFISSGLSAPDEGWNIVTIDDLCRFFSNPARFLVERRLHMYLHDDHATLDDREDFTLHPLDRFMLEDELLQKKLAGLALRPQYELYSSSGRLPHGAVGECVYTAMCRDIEIFAERVEMCMEGNRLPPRAVELDVAGFRLTGTIDELYPGGLVHYRYARIKARDLIRLWVHHLVLNCVAGGDYQPQSTLAGLRNTSGTRAWGAWRYGPIDNAETILGNLLRYFKDGLIRPLHLFPDTSWKYVELRLGKQKSAHEAMTRAQKAWMGSEFVRGECNDAYNSLCFQRSDPLDEEFEMTAIDIMGPIQRHMKEL